jgi:recombination protein RecT
MSTTTQAPPQQQQGIVKYTHIGQLLEAKKSELGAALPKIIGVDRFIRIVVTTAGEDRLKGCTLASLYKAALDCAQLGLMPDSNLGEAYLVPFNNKVKIEGQPDRWEKQAKMMLGYKGIVALALRSDKVLSMRANVIFNGDQWDYAEGLVTRLMHRPVPVANRKRTDEPGMAGYEMLAAYAVAKLRDVPADESPFKFMYAEDILAIRARSKNAFYENKLHGPWLTDPVAMWCKTAVRQLGKFLPLTPEVAKAIADDEYEELGVTTDQGATIEVPRQPVAQPRRKPTPQQTIEVQPEQPQPPQEPEDESQAPPQDERVQGSDASVQPQGESASPELTFDDQPPAAAAPTDPTTIPGVTKGMPAGDGKIKKNQFKLIHARRNGVGVTEDELSKHLEATYKSPHLNDLAPAHVNDVLAWLDLQGKK